MSPTWTAAASPLRSPAKAHERDVRRKPLRVATRGAVGVREQLADLLDRRDPHRSLGLAAARKSDADARVGADHPVGDGGPEDRPHDDEAGLDGARSPLVDMALTHASTWDRRIAFMGRSAKVTDPVARSALALVDGTHNCRGAHSA